MDRLVSVEQFSDFQFLLQQMLHIQDHPVQKSISDGVSFSKVTGLTTYNFGACTTLILENVPEISCLKKNILRKTFTLYQRLNKVTILPRKELALDPVEEALKILMCLQENLLDTNFFR